MISRTLLKWFGYLLLINGALGATRGDWYEVAATVVLGIAALITAARAPLEASVLPALRGLSLTAVAAALTSVVLPEHELSVIERSAVTVWFFIGLVGLYVFFHDEHVIDRQ